MRVILLSIFLIFSLPLFSQKSDCNIFVHGIVMDSMTNLPLEMTDIEIVGQKRKGTSTDSKGEFYLKAICAGAIEIHVSHMECEHIHLQLNLIKDTTLTIYLKHAGHLLEGFIAVAKINDKENLNRINPSEIQLKKGASISELMQNIGGIALLKTGSTISKPMVNGLHSNRVIILNNGIRQEGQNWGMEHAPEIDAFLATEIELLKGAESLHYASDGIGGVIMVKPPSIFNEKARKISGEFNLVGNSNGRGGAISIILGSKFSDKIPLYWRVQGTLKRSGNVKAPDYFMSNTGTQEANYSMALGYNLHHANIEMFHSFFYDKIGIFKGSQVGNIADLQRAFDSKEPLVTSGFTYKIDRPYQEVSHRLSKLNADWSLNAKAKLYFSIAYQRNHRQEYDIMRSATAYAGPDFNYFINTLLGDVNYKKTDLHTLNYRIGASGVYQTNSYSGRYFIPGFYNKGLAAYLIADKTIGRLKLEAALRYDYKRLTSYLWNGNNLTIADLTFHNATYLMQAAYRKNRNWQFKFASSSAWRPPAPNELYSNGLHQGLATIEVGDPNLKPERSFNQSLSALYNSKFWAFESEIFYKKINGFINLIPSLPPQQTIRGAFPVYRYVQQDALLTGLNFTVRHEIQNGIYFKLNGNLLIGENLDEHQPLSQMPPFMGKLWVGKENKQYMVQLWYQATARQFRYVEGSDYAPPPEGFSLFGFDASCHFNIRKQAFKFNVSVNNLFNTRYREYLNRFRYFSDEPGFGITARLIVPVNFN